MRACSNGGHSAIVKMQLRFNGTTIPIAKMGPDYIVVESASDHPPCEATIEMWVDDSESHWNVRLPNGISARSKRVVLGAPLLRGCFCRTVTHPRTVSKMSNHWLTAAKTANVTHQR